MRKIGKGTSPHAKKLQLHRETLRQLHSTELRQMRGGDEGPVTDWPKMSHEEMFQEAGQFAPLVC